MHSRLHSSGSGYRSNSMGMGNVAAASRISPEGSTIGNGMYGSDYQTYSRRFGHGQPKPFKPSKPPTSRGDIFMEAGRLATEYLVAKGLMSQNVLSGKWENGSFRPQDGENLQLPSEGRTSVLAHLKNVAPDSGSGRKMLPDEYNATGMRNYARGKKRMGSFDYTPDWVREVRRSRSWSEKASTDMEGYQEEQQVGNGSGRGMQEPHLNEIASKISGSDCVLDKDQLVEDIGSKASSSNTGIDLPQEADVELTKRSDDLKILSAGTEKQHDVDDVSIQYCAVEADRVSKSSTDLLSLCRFARVPTRARSSLIIKGPKADQVPIAEDGSHRNTGVTRVSGVPSEDVSTDGSSGDAQSNQIQSPKGLDSEVVKSAFVTSAENAGDLGCAYTTEQELTGWTPGFGRSNSMVMERGEKQGLPHIDGREGTKKPREWVPLVITQADDNLSLFNSRENQATSPAEEAIMAVDHERSEDMTLFPKAGTEPVIDYAEEKQLVPGSFKICDLNLIETSDVNENQDTEPTVIVQSTTTESKKEAAPVDADFSICNHGNISDKYGKHGAKGKEVEVIDLDNDSGQEDKAFDNSGRNREPEFTSMEDFPKHVQNTSEIPDGGCGRVVSELLENDISNFPSVPANINSLHNEMGLHRHSRR